MWLQNYAPSMMNCTSAILQKLFVHPINMLQYIGNHELLTYKLMWLLDSSQFTLLYAAYCDATRVVMKK